MTEQSSTLQPISGEESKNTLTMPLLYLSSTDVGWKGLVAQAFYEPAELEGWVTAPLPDISLVLFAGGGMRMEQREDHSSWKSRDLRHGHLMLSPGGGTPYALRWKALSKEPVRTLHLHLGRDLISRTAEEVADYDPARLALVGRLGFQDPLLAQIGFALWRELELHAPSGELYAQTAAQLLAVHLLCHYTSVGDALKEPAQGLTPKQMRRVTDFIQAHLDQDLSLEALAQQAGFSPYYFARMFRQTTGESPHHFVLHQRVERAQQLLKETTMPLAQIALESGFANQSHLTRVFKQQRDLTPLAYRRDR
jgi:AraC family transcriptional regulator